jgi:hypothetical protein
VAFWFERLTGSVGGASVHRDPKLLPFATTAANGRDGWKAVIRSPSSGRRTYGPLRGSYGLGGQCHPRALLRRSDALGQWCHDALLLATSLSVTQRSKPFNWAQSSRRRIARPSNRTDGFPASGSRTRPGSSLCAPWRPAPGGSAPPWPVSVPGGCSLGWQPPPPAAGRGDDGPAPPGACGPAEGGRIGGGGGWTDWAEDT